MLLTMQVSEQGGRLLPYRGQHDDYDELMGVPIRRFSSLDSVTFDTVEPARYLVDDPLYTLPIDMLFIPRRHPAGCWWASTGPSPASTQVCRDSSSYGRSDDGQSHCYSCLIPHCYNTKT